MFYTIGDTSSEVILVKDTDDNVSEYVSKTDITNSGVLVYGFNASIYNAPSSNVAPNQNMRYKRNAEHHKKYIFSDEYFDYWLGEKGFNIHLKYCLFDERYLKPKLNPVVAGLVVRDMGYCFAYSGLKTIDLSDMDTSLVDDMSGLFCGCVNLRSINLQNINTSNVNDMYRMFHGCGSLLSLDVSMLNTSKVVDMADMFNECRKLTALDISNFDTSNVTNMDFMFCECRNLLTLRLGNLKTHNVEGMHGMFRECEKLKTIDLSSFDTGKITDFRGMFFDCYNLDYIDLSSFTIMDKMSHRCVFEYSFNHAKCVLLPKIPSNVFGGYSCFSMQNVVVVVLKDGIDGALNLIKDTANCYVILVDEKEDSPYVKTVGGTVQSVVARIFQLNPKQRLYKLRG